MQKHYVNFGFAALSLAVALLVYWFIQPGFLRTFLLVGCGWYMAHFFRAGVSALRAEAKRREAWLKAISERVIPDEAYERQKSDTQPRRSFRAEYLADIRPMPSPHQPGDPVSAQSWEREWREWGESQRETHND